MKGSFKPVSRKKDIVVQKLKDETLIYDLKSNKAYCLNETSALVWQLCDGEKSALEIRDEMSKRLMNPVSEEFILIALDQLNKDGLLEEAVELDNQFAGLSRREVIRKVGFASVVALPTVSSLIAPRASTAQSVSGGALNTPCVVPGNTCDPGLACLNTFPPVATCCVPSAAFSNPPSTFIACALDQAGCNSAGVSTSCCSGAATITTDSTGCGFPNTFRCLCN